MGEVGYKVWTVYSMHWVGYYTCGVRSSVCPVGYKGGMGERCACTVLYYVSRVVCSVRVVGYYRWVVRRYMGSGG